MVGAADIVAAALVGRLCHLDHARHCRAARDMLPRCVEPYADARGRHALQGQRRQLHRTGVATSFVRVCTSNLLMVSAVKIATSC